MIVDGWIQMYCPLLHLLLRLVSHPLKEPKSINYRNIAITTGIIWFATVIPIRSIRADKQSALSLTNPLTDLRHCKLTEVILILSSTKQEEVLAVLRWALELVR